MFSTLRTHLIISLSQTLVLIFFFVTLATSDRLYYGLIILQYKAKFFKTINYYYLIWIIFFVFIKNRPTLWKPKPVEFNKFCITWVPPSGVTFFANYSVRPPVKVWGILSTSLLFIIKLTLIPPLSLSSPHSKLVKFLLINKKNSVWFKKIVKLLFVLKLYSG
jgi:hypothetical protein